MRIGIFVEQVVKDRQIVRREVPEHVDVGLEEAQVDAHRVVVAELAKFAGSQGLADTLNRAGEEIGMIDHQDHALAFGQVHQFFRFRDRRAHRLLDQDVLAGEDRLAGKIEMCGDRRGDEHSLDLAIADHVHCGGNHPAARYWLQGCAACLILVGYRNEIEVRIG